MVTVLLAGLALAIPATAQSLELRCEEARPQLQVLERLGLAAFQGQGGPSDKAPKKSFPRVDADLKAFDEKVSEMDREFAKLSADPKNKEWVKKKLAHMVTVDQYMRNSSDLPFQRKYNEEETKYFWEKFQIRFERIDTTNTRDLKKLLKIYAWFKISEFGAEADQDAWLLVQHADLNVPFQKEVLAQLEKLYPQGETSPSNYAYLYDRVAVHENRLQRYGTQGRCVGPGKWEPHPIEEPEKVDERRKAMGLEPLEEYKKRFKDICHDKD